MWKQGGVILVYETLVDDDRRENAQGLLVRCFNPVDCAYQHRAETKKD
jgi:hypothetical protein